MTRDEAQAALAEAGYAAEADAVLTEAASFPGRWAYTADRHRAVVLRADVWKVVDCAESEDRIARPPHDDAQEVSKVVYRAMERAGKNGSEETPVMSASGARWAGQAGRAR